MFRPQENACQIYRVHLIPDIQGGILDVLPGGRNGHSRVVHSHIEFAVARNSRRNSVFPLLLIRHIEMHEKRASSGIFNLSGYLPAFLIVDVSYNYAFHSFASKEFARGGANPRRAAGNNGDFTL